MLSVDATLVSPAGRDGERRDGSPLLRLHGGCQAYYPQLRGENLVADRYERSGKRTGARCWSGELEHSLEGRLIPLTRVARHWPSLPQCRAGDGLLHGNSQYAPPTKIWNAACQEPAHIGDLQRRDTDPVWVGDWTPPREQQRLTVLGAAGLGIDQPREHKSENKNTDARHVRRARTRKQANKKGAPSGTRKHNASLKKNLSFAGLGSQTMEEFPEGCFL